MATPKPGEIRCPTCHRSTPPAAFCTQCGSRIPADALARPRGMDRDELQERIRARRSGGEPWRRGAQSPGQPGGYEPPRYEPRPEDADAWRGPGRPSEQRTDRYADEQAPSAWPSADAARDPDADASDRWSTAGLEAEEPWPAQRDRGYVDNYDDAGDQYAYGTDGYTYDYPYQEERRRRGGGAGLAILGVLALGVLALMGGAVLAGVFSEGTAEATATPTAADATPTPLPTVAATATPANTRAPSGSPAASAGPIVFPDGFVAEAQPCLPGTADTDGCNSNGSVNSGTVDVWIGFEKGTGDDVIGATLVGPDGTVVAEGFIDLTTIGCKRTCNGWTRFNFSGLDSGNYEVRITRNGDPAATATFEVA